MTQEKARDQERNITDADRACPKLVSFREKNDGELKPLNEGEIIGRHWKVVRPIDPELGFNTIYVVSHMKKDYQGALKIEPKKSSTPMLKFELFILLQMEQRQKTKQFCKVFDRGMEPEFNWVVITLSGKSLKELRKEANGGKITLACGLSVGMQCLKALEEIHKVGFIHRSVSPSKFAIGRMIGDDPKELRNVYILDFGFAHQYKLPDGTHKPPRPQPWRYMGSLRHAPRNAYLEREFSRLDDVESWLYMLVEMVKGSLPWVHQRNPKDVFEYQKLVRSGLGLREFLGGLPVEFVDIMKEVDRLAYKDEPNYNEIYGLLGNAILMSGLNEFPYDWEAAEIEQAKAEAKEKNSKEKDGKPATSAAHEVTKK